MQRINLLLVQLMNYNRIFALSFELLFRDIKNLNIADQKKELLKARIKDYAHL